MALSVLTVKSIEQQAVLAAGKGPAVNCQLDAQFHH